MYLILLIVTKTISSTLQELRNVEQCLSKELQQETANCCKKTQLGNAVMLTITMHRSKGKHPLNRISD